MLCSSIKRIDYYCARYIIQTYVVNIHNYHCIQLYYIFVVVVFLIIKREEEEEEERVVSNK